jgi:5'-3' exonuclease
VSGVHRVMLDTSSLLYRAFFALPDSIKDPEGRPVNAVHGYLDMTKELIRNRGPEEVIHALDDDWKPAPRVASYAGYKAQRPEEPEAITRQFALLQEVLEATEMTVADAPGWEAEDAIGSLCARSKASDRIDIVTGDRDLLQLVRDPAVRVLITRRGVSDLAEMDEAAVEEKHGVPASRYAEYAMLRGDSSDGLPGVPGVGEKTAKALTLAYPSLDELIEDARGEHPKHRPLKGSPGLRARLRAAEDYLRAMQDVVPIRTDLELRVRPGTRDDERLDELGERHRLKNPIGRLRAVLDAA